MNSQAISSSYVSERIPDRKVQRPNRVFLTTPWVVAVLQPRRSNDGPEADSPAYRIEKLVHGITVDICGHPHRVDEKYDRPHRRQRLFEFQVSQCVRLCAKELVPGGPRRSEEHTS